MLDLIHPDLRSLALPIDSLTEDPANANKHGDRNLAAIAESFKRFGQRKPLVVRREGMVVEAGNGTLAALREAGWTHLACVVCDDDEQTAMAFGLVDNQSARLAEWDFTSLRDNVETLLESGYDVLGLGWSGDELADIMAGKAEALAESLGGDKPDANASTPSAPSDDFNADVDYIPEPPAEPITIAGEVVTIGPHTLHCADCMDVLRSLPDNSVDAIVTDPPYGLSPDGRARTWDEIELLRAEGKGPKAGFMGRAWDAGVPGQAWARECLRVLKPGGHLVAFSATRTYHRLACAVEDAGFEIRDMIAWAQWQGFPKSLDVSKAIDRMKDDREETLEVTRWIASARDAAGLKNSDLDAPFGFVGMSGHWTSQKSQPTVPTLEQVPTLLAVLGVDEPPPRIKELLLDLNAAKGEPGPNWWKRAITGQHETPAAAQGWRANYGDGDGGTAKERRDEAATAEAEQWEGWGTALKPAIEPHVLARKPLENGLTVAQNVLKWGTGAINVDACRYALGDLAWPGPNEDWGERHNKAASGAGSGGGSEIYGYKAPIDGATHNLGRWPANIYACPKPATGERNDGCAELPVQDAHETTGRKEGSAGSKHARAGRTADGMANHHPTVKPVRLMRWLLRLVTPPGGTVVEPFGGSGTTLVAAAGLDCCVIAAEREPGYCDIIRARVEHSLR